MVIVRLVVVQRVDRVNPGSDYKWIQHGNDSLFYTAVEPDSLIAILWHFCHRVNP